MTIRKHWFGLFIIIVRGALLALALGVIPLTISNVDPSGRSLALLAFLVGELTVFLLSAVAISVYDRNVMVIRPERLEFHNQYALFASRSSECNVWEIEDVSYTQNGIFPALIGYGTLMVQTAGTQEKFTFSFCPKPEWVKDYIDGLEKAPSQYYSTT